MDNKNTWVRSEDGVQINMAMRSLEYSAVATAFNFVESEGANMIDPAAIRKEKSLHKPNQDHSIRI